MIKYNEHCIVFTVYIDRLMLIKAITLFRLRAVSDFVFVFCSLINIEEAPICRARTHTHAHTLQPEEQRLSCGLYFQTLSNMSSNLATVKTAFYNNRQTIDLILMLSFGQGGTNARRCEEKEVVLEETWL